MIRFETMTGSVYDYDDSGQTLTRLSVGGLAHPLRRDGDTLKVLHTTGPVVGEPAVFHIEPLASDAAYTTRTTSPVIRTWDPESDSEKKEG